MVVFNVLHRLYISIWDAKYLLEIQNYLCDQHLIKKNYYANGEYDSHVI